MDNYFLWGPIIFGILAILCWIIIGVPPAKGNGCALILAVIFSFLAVFGLMQNNKGKPISVSQSDRFHRLVVGETYRIKNKTEHNDRVYYLLAGSDITEGLLFYTSEEPMPPKFVVQKDYTLKEVP